MKKLFLFAFAALALAACNDNDDTLRFAAENTLIENGSLTGTNMHFLGTSTVTSADGDIYVGKEACFEFAGLDDFTLYMHNTRFAAAMPALKMRLYSHPYTPGEGASLSFALESAVPDVYLPNDVGGGYSYQPMPAYTLTDVEGSIDNTLCRVSFSCNVPRLGSYRVEFEGRLLE